ETQSKIINNLKSQIKCVLKGLQAKGSTRGWRNFFLREILVERNERNVAKNAVFSVSVSKGLINQIEHLGRSFAAKDTSNYNVVHNGDVVYTKSPTGEFPYGIIKQSFQNKKVAVSPLYGVYIPRSIYIGNIIHYYFDNPISANNYLHSLVQKGAKNTINITNSNFLNNKVNLPTSQNEIISIAKTLNLITEKITLEEKLLYHLKCQKKYFLQNLFI
ncbi:restriction endonuclease subunit S, partial [Pedobacter miscanthi]